MAKTVDEKKIIYTMERVSRSYGTKVVLKDISISYYYGAKIGVVGENGAGKSSLFKILAGVDKDFVGETHVSPGYTLGYLEQEPVLEAGKTVKEIVMEGVKPITDLLAEFDKVNEAFGDPDADFDKLCARQAELQEKLDAADAWNLDANLELSLWYNFKCFWFACKRLENYCDRSWVVWRSERYRHKQSYKMDGLCRLNHGNYRLGICLERQLGR